MPVISGIGAVIAGLVSLYIVFFIHKIKLAKQPLPVLKKYFKDSIPIFVSNVSVKIYVSTNKVIIGAFLGMAEVSYYDLGEKITSLLKIPQGLLSQTLFPKINKDKDIHFVKKVFFVSVALNIILFVGIVLFSKPIVMLLGGEQMIPAIRVVTSLHYLYL
jgi:PST family polysaccharide transporter